LRVDGSRKNVADCPHPFRFDSANLLFGVTLKLLEVITV
jgi:hypothetical protein